MNLTETITWVPVSEKRPKNLTDIIFRQTSGVGPPVCGGYRDGNLYRSSIYRYNESQVDYYTEMPKGPK